MGNSESSNVTLEKEQDQFVVTTDGVKLSPALINQMLAHQESETTDRETGELEHNLSDVKKKLRAEQHALDETREMLSEREKQMNKLNETWKQRLDEERRKQNEFNKITLEEFEDAANKVEKKFARPKLTPVCAGLQAAMVQCYNDNRTTTLNCSSHVHEFSKCVEQAQEAYLSKREQKK